MFISFLFASLYFLYQIKISTLMDVPYGILGTLIVGLSISLIYMTILETPWL